ncbi:hypothetical protein QOZ80_2BG0169240 [Eleusine coracana subsp. coracana]|nr:hypothetical protein QOZ80_2BG0169240 [Eleusine coracana subsp. coracana]
MAVVLDAYACYVANLLMEMAREEVGVLLGVSSEIDSMGIKLGDLKNLLADADRKSITDYRVQGWVRELKDAMFDATDILDLCQLRAMECGPTTMSTASCCKSVLFCLQNPPFAHYIGGRIRVLNRKLDDIRERSAQFRFVNLVSYEDHNSKVTSHSAANRETTGEPFRPNVVVGEKIKEDTKGLVEMLTEKCGSSRDIMVVAVVGVGGIGKTTLAREIFNHEGIKDSFDKRIWLSVNQNFDKAELLRTAITLAGGDHHGEKAMAVLQPALATALAGKKLLLVMDDVWCHKAWEDVLQTPLVNGMLQEGSRVIITTRDERVARAMKAEQPYHHVDKLGLEDAWSLLKKQVVSSNNIDEVDIDMLKDIGMQIIAKCDGLPLAVKLLQVDHAPAITHVGADFQRPYSHPSHIGVAFPRLHRLEFIGMVEWEEWEWAERADVQVMPVLDLLVLKRCNLWSLPTGLASHARMLKKLFVYEVQHLSSLENLVSIVELEVFDNPNLEKIRNLPKLQKLTIVKCQKMKILMSIFMRVIDTIQGNDEMQVESGKACGSYRLSCRTRRSKIQIRSDKRSRQRLDPGQRSIDTVHSI